MGIKHVGQIGLGAVGIHFAHHLLGHYGALTVFDIDASRLERATALGATPTDNLEMVASKCDTIILSLPNPDAVREVLAGPGGLALSASPNTLIVDCSTIDPETSRWASDQCSNRKVRYVEAPVTSAAPGGGSTEGAKAGNVTFLVGGDDSSVVQAAELFELLGERYLHLGPVGSGSIMKLVTNHVSGVITLAVAEGLVLAAAAGFPVDQSLDIIKHSVADNYVLNHILAARIRQADYEPGFAIDLMHKDHVLAAELGRKLTVPLLFNQLAAETFQLMRAQGLGNVDHAFCAQYLAELARVDLENGGKLDV
jgi:3-hydroxyisobutyrate dehydrogenase-like beta-hydroxyacid dehydrogenase